MSISSHDKINSPSSNIYVKEENPSDPEEKLTSEAKTRFNSLQRNIGSQGLNKKSTKSFALKSILLPTVFGNGNGKSIFLKNTFALTTVKRKTKAISKESEKEDSSSMSDSSSDSSLSSVPKNYSQNIPFSQSYRINGIKREQSLVSNLIREKRRASSIAIGCIFLI